MFRNKVLKSTAKTPAIAVVLTGVCFKIFKKQAKTPVSAAVLTGILNSQVQYRKTRVPKYAHVNVTAGVDDLKPSTSRC